MSTLHRIDNDLLLKWLQDLQIAHYLCGQCQGIHMAEIQGLEGVMESRLFLDEDCLIFTTEVEVRDASLFYVQAELPRVNAAFVHLKAFLDAIDQGGFQLVLCGTLWISAGISRKQLEVFLKALIDAKMEVIATFQQQDCLYRSEDGEDPKSLAQLH